MRVKCFSEFVGWPNKNDDPVGLQKPGPQQYIPPDYMDMHLCEALWTRKSLTLYHGAYFALLGIDCDLSNSLHSCLPTPCTMDIALSCLAYLPTTYHMTYTCSKRCPFAQKLPTLELTSTKYGYHGLLTDCKLGPCLEKLVWYKGLLAVSLKVFFLMVF